MNWDFRWHVPPRRSFCYFSETPRTELELLYEGFGNAAPNGWPTIKKKNEIPMSDENKITSFSKKKRKKK